MTSPFDFFDPDPDPDPDTDPDSDYQNKRGHKVNISGALRLTSLFR